jgi:tetratricopeptide (TPR) repeat protein
MQAGRLRSSPLAITKLMKLALIFLLSAFILGCNRGPQPVANSNSLPDRPMRSGQAQNVIAHTTENQTPKPANAPGGGKWSQSGDPIDTSKFDEAIASAEKNLKGKPGDDEAKKNLAQAFFQRGFALTEARQYASALGDYRRALKYDPAHADSKKWIEQIVGIYSMLKKDAPKEGEEPPPLPFKKEA